VSSAEMRAKISRSTPSDASSRRSASRPGDLPRAAGTGDMQAWPGTRLAIGCDSKPVGCICICTRMPFPQESSLSTSHEILAGKLQAYTATEFNIRHPVDVAVPSNSVADHYY
jgi:hypothetical protein